MTTPTRLIVVMAFDLDPETDEPFPAGEPIQADSEERAIRTAKSLAGKHTGVIAWSRTADPNIGEYGEPEILFQSGQVGELD